VRVVFTQRTKRQLRLIYRYIAANSSQVVAENYVARIVEFCRNLQQFPLRGSARDDLMTGLRTNGFERRATIAFTVSADIVLIEGVFYGGQDFEKTLRR
jgi:toxin ParE1/3/4